MKKIIFRAFAFAVITALLTGVVCGCKKKPDAESEEAAYVLQETEHYLIKNNNSDYRIVISGQAHSDEVTAANELQKLFEEITEIRLPVITDNEAAYSASSKYILMGNNVYAAQENLHSGSAAMGASGYILSNKGSNVFLYGGGTAGTHFSVYGFLNYQFGYEFFATDEIGYKKETRERKLLLYKDCDGNDIIEKPDIPYRSISGKYYYDLSNARKLKLNTVEETFLDKYGVWHNSYRFLPPEEYNDPSNAEKYHPEWYSDKTITSGTVETPVQLHYTAHGNADSLKLMRQEVLNKMISMIDESVAAGVYKETIAFTHQDNWDWADDSSLDEEKDKYGNAFPAATIIQFLNPIIEDLREYMQENHEGRKIRLVTFAYRKTEIAPVKLENGGYVPIDASVVPDGDLIVLYAPLKANFTQPLSHQSNSYYMEILERWKGITDNISFWFYSTYFNNYLMFYDYFNSFQENVKLITGDFSAYFFLSEGNWNHEGVGFSVLKEYLMSKFMWNTKEDITELTQRFFDNYYKQASKSMLKLYRSLRDYSRILIEHKSYNGDVFSQTFANAEFWPKQKLAEFLSMIDDAYSDIAIIEESDAELYNKLKKRITAESIMFRYLLLKNYHKTIPDLQEQRDAFMNDCADIGITRYSTADNGDTFDFILNEWKYLT